MSNRYFPIGAVWVLILASAAQAQEIRWGIMPEQRSLSVRSPEQLRPAGIPRTAAPATVNSPQWDVQAVPLSLSEVLNRSLGNMDAVRVLSGVNANSTGRTIYDVGINNTGIDAARGAFDPNLNINNNFLNGNSPGAIPDPGDPTQTLIVGSRNDRNNFNMNLSKRALTGGVIDFGVNGGNNRFPGLTLPLNPQLQSNASIQLTQPLLQGAGVAVNQAPIVIAQLDTERSYFQFKDSVQTHVESIVQGYWNLVQARTDLWARKQQVELLEFAVKQAEVKLEIGDQNYSPLLQQRVAIENFRASVLVAEGNLLQRESALRNVLGLSPFDNDRIIPTTPLIDQKITWDWNELLSLAEQYRPDIIELKLILEADQQRMLIRNNDARPSLDAVALYRWNGLEGTMPNGSEIRGTGFDDWSLGVNFSVPLGLRAARAGLRQQELLIQRDQVNLQQGLHQAAHNLAIRVRNIELFFAQYERFQKVREAATENLKIQTGNFELGREPFIVVLQAVVDWGNAVSNEAQALVQYNAELAALERETGTILETHGIAFVEERFGSIGPLGRLAVPVEYPGVLSPGGENGRYPNGNRPAEQQFRLDPPVNINERGDRAPGELPPSPAELPLPNQEPAPIEATPPLGSRNTAPVSNPPRVSDNKSLTPSLFRYSPR